VYTVTKTSYLLLDHAILIQLHSPAHSV